MSGDWCQSVACLYSLSTSLSPAKGIHRRQTLLRLKTSAADLVPGRTESDSWLRIRPYDRTLYICTVWRKYKNILLSLTGLKGQNHEIFNTFLPKNSTLARYEQANYFSPNLSYLRRYSRKTCQPIRIHASRESWMKWNLDKDTRCWSKIEQMFLEPISFCDFGAFFHVGDIAQLAFFLCIYGLL